MFYSVITPAFNAEHTIERVYQSLLNQTFKDFEWIVVDDGSTDQTSVLIESYQTENLFPIKLVQIQNQHKKTAIRHGIEQAQGTMTLIADADDDIPPLALKIMFDAWQQVTDKDNYNAVCGLCVDQQGQLIGNQYPKSPLDCNAIEMRLLHKVAGEKWGCVLTVELRDSYPNFDKVQGHVPEGIYQRKLASKKTRFVNEVVRIYYTDVGGSITNSSFNPINAHGILLDAVDWLDNYSIYLKVAPIFFLKRAAAYNKYRRHLTYSQQQSVLPKTRFAKIMIFTTCLARIL